VFRVTPGLVFKDRHMGSHRSTVNRRKKIKRRIKNERTRKQAAKKS